MPTHRAMFVSRPAAAVQVDYDIFIRRMLRC